MTTNSTSRAWRSALLGATVAALAMLSVSVIAMPGARHGPGSRLFERADANADGAVSRAEAESLLAAEQAGLDADRDGSVSFEELKAFRAAKREQRARERFARHDADGDGRVSLAEFNQRFERRFVFLDRNDDGQISEDERPRHGRH